MNEAGKNLDILDIVLRRKWMIVIPLAFGTLIGWIVANSLPAYYKSSTLIMVEQQKVPESFVQPTDETPIERRLSTISQQIMSRTKLEQIIDDFNLYSEKPDGMFSKYMSSFGVIADNNESKSKEEAVGVMRKDIEVKVLGEVDRNRGGDAFSVSYIGTDPSVTMQVTNILASFFIEENLKAREQYAEGTSEFLSEELEKAKQELEKQEQSLKWYKERYMGKLPQQMEANLRTLDRLQIELQATQAALKNAEDRKHFLEEQDRLSPVSTQAGSTDIRTTANPLQTELTRLKSELSTLLSTYTEAYPDVITTRNRITDVERQIKEEKTTTGDPDQVNVLPATASRSRNSELVPPLTEVNMQIPALKKKEEKIREQISLYERRVEDTPASEQLLANIERDYETSRLNYQSLLGKKLNAELAESMEKRQKGQRFKIIDSANLPEAPFKPDKAKITIGGSGIGFGLGVGLVYLLEFLNPAFRKPEDFIGLIDKPVLALIPLYAPSAKFEKGNKKSNATGKGRS